MDDYESAHQAQNQATQGRDLSTLAPLRALRARTPVPAWARRAVGEGVSSCPRGGCGRSARPVRMQSKRFQWLAPLTVPHSRTLLLWSCGSSMILPRLALHSCPRIAERYFYHRRKGEGREKPHRPASFDASGGSAPRSDRGRAASLVGRLCTGAVSGITEGFAVD